MENHCENILVRFPTPAKFEFIVCQALFESGLTYFMSFMSMYRDKNPPKVLNQEIKKEIILMKLHHITL